MRLSADIPDFAYRSVLSCALDAGAILMEHYHRADLDIQHKADHSPVTQADIASQDFISAFLQENFPEIPIISEEATLADYEQRKHWPRFWLVDPLDGTKEFIKKNGEFTVNIALIEQGIPVFGVIYAPALAQLYFGAQHTGSWRQTSSQVTRLRCQRKALDQPLRLVCSRSHPSTELNQWIEAHQIVERVPTGSSLKFCRVAEGAADVYLRFHAIREWDVAAGDAIYRYASEQAPHPSALTYNTPNLHTPAFMIGAEDIVPLL
jgi:3'(2'), 5'-bisphosphate nucleotidase